MVQAHIAETRAPSSAKPGTVLAVTDIRDIAFSYVDSQSIVRVGFARVYGKPGQEAVAVMNPQQIEQSFVEPQPLIKEGILRRLRVGNEARAEDLPEGVPGGEG